MCGDWFEDPADDDAMAWLGVIIVWSVVILALLEWY
jgi:hypothetical protein